MEPEIQRVANLKYITGESRADAERKAFRFGMWLAAEVLGNSRAKGWCKNNIKAVSESANELGGAWVPVEFEPMLIDLRERYGIFRANTSVVQMGTDLAQAPRRRTGATLYWVGENEAVTESEGTWDSIGLSAKKLGALVVCSNEIYEDAAINLGDEVAYELAWGFSRREDECGFIGDGTSTYRGMTGVVNKLKGLSSMIANIAGLAVATGTGYGTNYASMTLADFNATAALLPAYADTPNCGWFMNRSFFYGVAQRLELANGGAAQREAAFGTRPPRPLFLGYPVNFAQPMPKISAVSQVVALFGDLSRSSKLGHRRQTKLFINPYKRSSTYQIELTAFQRFDIITHDVGNATSVAADKEPGPIVGLITAAS